MKHVKIHGDGITEENEGNKQKDIIFIISDFYNKFFSWITLLKPRELCLP